MDMSDIKTLLVKVVELIDLGEDKTEEIVKILSQVVLYIELGGIVTDGLSAIKDILDGDEISQEKLNEVLTNNEKRIQAAKARVLATVQ